MSYKVYSNFRESITERIFSVLKLDCEIKEDILSRGDKLLDSNAECVVKATKRILQAKMNNEKVLIAGDYDADGIMATTIIKSMLDDLGINNGYYIPNRFIDGYGLISNTVKLAYDKGYTLIITVDNGVKAYEALTLAKELGIDVIVTDHHQIEDDIDVYCLIHPSLLEEEYSYLSGAGVALVIARKFNDNYRHLIFAMIATIGDQMIMLKANRTIVHLGLAHLNETLYPSVASLMNDVGNYNETDISFNIVPKINSLGRLNDNSNPNVLVQYFLCNDIEEIMHMKQQINECNDKRKKMSKAMVDKGQLMIDDNNIIVIDDPSFEEGICGLAAGAIANKYQKPTIVLSVNDNILKGSGRSIKGVNLYEYLGTYKDLFLTFGGHMMAVGLSMHKDNYAEFKLRIKNNPLGYTPYDEEVIEIREDELSLGLMKELEQLRPFGQGFKLPLFIIKDIEVDKKMMIKNMYPKWKFKNKSFEAISFDETLAKIDNPKYFIFEPQINEFNGKQRLSMLVKMAG